LAATGTPSRSGGLLLRGREKRGRKTGEGSLTRGVRKRETSKGNRMEGKEEKGYRHGISPKSR